MHRRQILVVQILIAGIVLTTPAQTGSSVNQTNGKWVLPQDIGTGTQVTVETGPETNPLHKDFESCATKLLRTSNRHGTTERASENLATQPEAGKGAVIVGHGSPGIACTGNGDNCPGASQSIAYDDASEWKQWLEKIPRDAPLLTILACDVGEGPLGTTLLSRIAQTIKRPVRAPDGIIFCHDDGIEFYDAQWVEVSPTLTPSPRVRIYSIPVVTQGDFMISDRHTIVPIDAVRILQLSHRGYREVGFTDFSRGDLQKYLSLIDFAHPFEDAGSPAGILTAQIRVQVKLAGREEPIMKKFAVYNDELLEDLDYSDVYYRADSRLAVYFSAR